VLTATRPDRKVAPVLSAAAAAVLVLGGINLFHTFESIHEHNDGPLGPLSGGSFSLEPESGSGPWTSGYELCLEDGPDAVILESIAPTSKAGTGLRFLGAVVRVIHPGTNDSIGEEAGYPPRVTDVLHPVAGYRVTQQCNFTRDGQPNGQPQPTTELDVGIGKPPGSTGGGWSGFNVAYRVGTTQYIATWDTGFWICGPTAPAAASCEQPS
jgi:hypothetical protein